MAKVVGSIEVKQNAGLAAIPDHIAALMGSSAGFENVGSEDIVMPRLELVQGLSKCRQKDDPTYIKGSNEGDFYNNVTRELYGNEVVIVPVAFKKEYLLWRDLAKGGGFAGAYSSEIDANSERSRQDNPDEWEAILTHQHFCLVENPDTGQWDGVVLSMARSKLKISKRWNSLISFNSTISGKNLPRWAKTYRLRGITDKNANNQAFQNIDASSTGEYTPAEVVGEASKIYDLFKTGNLGIDREMDVIDIEVNEEI